MDLNRFPSEILAHILSLETTTFLIVRLWKCGDQLLNAKLAQGAHNLDLRADSKLEWASPPAPLLLLELPHLRNLALKSTKTLLSSGLNWYDFVKRLPSSLEGLSIEGPGIVSLLIPPRALKHSVINYARKFPHLASLSLVPHQDNHESKLEPIIVQQLSLTLPPSLKTLTLGTLLKTKIDDLKLLMALLPRSLTNMDFDLENFGDASDEELCAIWSKAPPHLRRIRSITLAVDDRSLEWLPRTLVDVDIRSPNKEHFLVWNQRYNTTFPPLAQQLSIKCPSIDTFGGDWPIHLPRNLTELSLQTYFKPHSLGKNIADLPRSLQILRIPGGLIFWDEVRQALEDEKMVNQTFQFWPPNLTMLDLLSHKISQENLLLLSSSIRVLKVALGPQPPSFTPNPDLNIFPPLLTKLAIHHDPLLRYEVFDTPSYQLPAHLTSLKIPRWHIHWFSKIPRSVTHLTLDCCITPKESGFQHQDIFADLPKDLRLLDVCFASNRGEIKILHQLSSRCFSTLRELVVLRVYAADFASSIFKSLSSTLHELTMQFVQNSIDEKDVQFMPPHLRRFTTSIGASNYARLPSEYWPIRCTLPSFGKNTKSANQRSSRMQRILDGDANQ